jgi:Tat protein secretion system quality control protein TatD with DNase activity
MVKAILSGNGVYFAYYGIEQALAFLTAEKLNGKRHSGPMEEILTNNENTVLSLHSFENTRNEPIMIVNNINDRAIICSNISSSTNQNLIVDNTKTNGYDIKLLQ